MRTMQRVCTGVVVVAVLGLASLAGGQSFQGGMRGAVKDAQGVIPGVTISLLNEATNVSRDTVSNQSGEYSFPALDNGSYTAKAAAMQSVSFGNANFGRVTSQGNYSRTLQVTGRLSF